MACARSTSHSTTPVAVSAAVLAGLAAIECARPAQAQTYDFRQRALELQASRRDYRELEANGFRYVGTDGYAPYVYYVYRRSDGREYHCGQNGWKTGACFPGNRRDPQVLPRHIRIADLKNAGYRYGGVRHDAGKVEHIYTQPQNGTVYLCPNEGYASCRIASVIPARRRTAAGPRSVLD